MKLANHTENSVSMPMSVESLFFKNPFAMYLLLWTML